MVERIEDWGKQLAASALLFLLAIPAFSLPAVDKAALKNGIPVYVATEKSRLVSVRIVVTGGAAYLDEDTAGLERAAFNLMTYGSAKYSKDDLDRMGYDYSFSVSSSASQDAAALSVTFIDKYLKTALPVLCDIFMHPSFTDKSYNEVMDDIKEDLLARKSDPERMLGDAVSTAIYADHPYRVKSFVTDKSLDSITVENMRALHGRDMDARRIFIAASGNITARALASRLNPTIGTIPTLDTPLVHRTIPPIAPSGDNITITSSLLDGSGYMQCVASGPAVTDDDALAALVASEMYSRQLFNVVREAQGVCYSAYSLCSIGVIGSTGVYLYKVSDLTRATAAEREARRLLRAGKLATGKNADGTFVYTDISDAIDGVKNTFLNSYYDNSTSRAAVASRIAYSVITLGEPNAYDALIERISDVTASEALAAFNKYWTQDGGQWFTVVGPNDVDKVKY